MNYKKLKIKKKKKKKNTHAKRWHFSGSNGNTEW